MHASDLSYLGEPFPSWIILLVDILVLVEIQYIRVERLVIPIFEHKHVAVAHCAIVGRCNLMFLSHKFRLCWTEQMFFVAFKKRSSLI